VKNGEQITIRQPTLKILEEIRGQMENYDDVINRLIEHAKEDRKLIDTPQTPDIRYLEQILEHVESQEKIMEKMMIVSAVENTIITRLSELKESVLSQLKLLVWHQYQALKEASS